MHIFPLCCPHPCLLLLGLKLLCLVTQIHCCAGFCLVNIYWNICLAGVSKLHSGSMVMFLLQWSADTTSTRQSVSLFIPQVGFWGLLPWAVYAASVFGVLLYLCSCFLKLLFIVLYLYAISFWKKYLVCKISFHFIILCHIWNLGLPLQIHEPARGHIMAQNWWRSSVIYSCNCQGFCCVVCFDLDCKYSQVG